MAQLNSLLVTGDSRFVNTIKGNCLTANNGIYNVIGTQTSATGTWTGSISVPALYDGITIMYYLPYAGSGNATLNLTLSDGSTTGAINCYYNGTTRLTTHYSKGSNIIMTYHPAGAISIDGTATTDARWIANADYFQTNTNTIGEYGGSIIAGGGNMAKYSLVMQTQLDPPTYASLVTTSSTGTTKAKQTCGFLPNGIVLYQSGGTYAEGAAAGQASVWVTYPTADLRYSFNSATIGAAGDSVYIKCTKNSTDNKLYLAGTTWWSNALPTTQDNYYYIYVGQLYSAYACTLYPNHPIYYHDGTKLQLLLPNEFPSTGSDTWRDITVGGTSWKGTGTDTGALNFVQGSNVTLTNSGNDLTIAATDTTYESKTAASGGTAVSLCTTGEKYTWNNKTDSTNPTGTGYFSLNRKASTTVGTYSFAEGYNATASGNYSHAEGRSTTASGSNSHAEGYLVDASGDSAHAEGTNTTASATDSHAEGLGTTASGTYSHAEGYHTTANHKSQHVFGEYNIADPSTALANARGNYVEIVGNGTSNSAKSNARTLDWNGNETLAGSLTIGGQYVSTSPTGFILKNTTWDPSTTPSSPVACNLGAIDQNNGIIGGTLQFSTETDLSNRVALTAIGSDGGGNPVYSCIETKVSESGVPSIILSSNTHLANTAVDVTEADNGVSSNTLTRLLFTDGMATTAENGISAVSSAAYANGRTATFINCRNYTTGGAEAANHYLKLYADKDGTVGVGLSHPAAWLSALGITNSSIILSLESGATIEAGGAYRFGPIVVINVVFKLTKSFANGTKICTIPTQNTESRFMAYTGTDAWFAGKAMMPCRFHGSALKPIGATPTASSTNPIYLYVNQTYITSTS